MTKWLAAAAVLMATGAGAGPVQMIAGSRVEIGPTQRPGAVAEVTFTNHPSNGPDDNGSFQIELGAVAVLVTFTWNANFGGDDELFVETGPGFVAVPPVLQVAESGVGVVVIYPLEGVGM